MFRPQSWSCCVPVAVAICNSLIANAAPTVTLQSSLDSPTLGRPVKFTATVSPSTSTGSVTFFDGVNILGAGQISNGQATLTTSLLTAGPHSIFAFYGGQKSAIVPVTVRSLPDFGFQSVQTPGPYGNNGSMAVADFNNDGIPDLVFTTFTVVQMVGAESWNLTVLLGNGDGTFRPTTQISGGRIVTAVATGDFNGDGITDIATVDGVYLGNGDGTFQSSLPINIGDFNVVSLAVGDFNGDGRADLAWSGWPNGTSVGVIGILPGNGDGTFQASVNTSLANGGMLAVADFNQDGRADLAVAQGANSATYAITILLGNGDCTFQTPALYNVNFTAQTIAVADFNGDGRPDVAVGGYIANGLSSSTSPLSIFLSNPDGSLQNSGNYTVPGATTHLATGDFNGDGRIDVAYLTGVLTGNGDGTFQTSSLVATSLSSPLAAGDFNSDGRTDLVATFETSSNTGLEVLLGRPAPQGAPAIASVLNAASFQPGIAAGSWVMIQGSGLANSTRAWQNSDFIGDYLPTVLDGVSVTIDGNPAFVEYISPTQINVQAPWDNITGVVNVVVTNNGAASAPATAQLQAVAPAFFMDSSYNAIAALLPGYTPVSASAPAHPGDLVVLWGTGFGATTPSTPAGIIVSGAPATSTPIVTVGGMQVQVVSSVLTAGTVGLYQITIQLPANVPAGSVELQASIGGVQTQAGVTIAIQ
jgi:uncharacterized protein (TIGR03437 family)